MFDDFLLAIPVFNEEPTVERVIEESLRHSRHILIIDDGSTDDTALRLRRFDTIHIITHPENRGYGQSLADAFSYARRKGFAWLITMDCDEQHEPAAISTFLSAAAHDDADVISGTRYQDGFNGDSPAPPDRIRINRSLTALLNDRLGLELTDAFCGFKAYRVSSLGEINITIPGYAMPMQFWVQAARAGLRVRELPVRLIYDDPNRFFGGMLDDPEARLQHYLDVFHAECAQIPKPIVCDTPPCMVGR